MTISEVIAFVDGIEPNAYTDAQKTVWLTECEGQVYLDVYLLSAEEFAEAAADFDGSTELSVPIPHDRIYRDYLHARVLLANGEYDRYQNAMTVFNAEWGDFVRWYARVYDPSEHLPIMHPES